MENYIEIRIVKNEMRYKQKGIKVMEKFIIYGAGECGRNWLEFLNYKKMQEHVHCFVDRNAESIKDIDGVLVLTFEETLELDFPYFISMKNPQIRKEIENTLKFANKKYASSIEDIARFCGEDMVSFNRDYCAYCHINASYFERAEQSDWLNTFWDKNGDFYKMFIHLDLSNVIELACGHGRHVPMYCLLSGHITLVDILKDNIIFCKERFKDKTNISYYCNNGFNLSDLNNNVYTSLFTYDAMVHFEMLDIASYLKEFYRVLVPGGYALIHHSNNTADYTAAFGNGLAQRSYMSADIFAYLAYRSGFEIVEQKIIDWEGEKDLDCITLLRKPYLFNN